MMMSGNHSSLGFFLSSPEAIPFVHLFCPFGSELVFVSYIMTNFVIPKELKPLVRI